MVERKASGNWVTVEGCWPGLLDHRGFGTDSPVVTQTGTPGPKLLVCVVYVHLGRAVGSGNHFQEQCACSESFKEVPWVAGGMVRAV